MSFENIIDFLARLEFENARRALEEAIARVLADEDADLYEAHQLWEDGDFDGLSRS